MPSIKRAIDLIQLHHPTTPEQFENIGLTLEPLANGAFRETAKVKGLPLVVKFPLSDDDDTDSYAWAKRHTTSEARKVEILSTFKELRPYLPKIYYHNRETGIMVMRYYPKFENSKKQFEALGWLVRKLVKKLTKVEMADIHDGNFHKGRGKRGGILIDLGY